MFRNLIQRITTAVTPFALWLENVAERRPWQYAFLSALMSLVIMGLLCRPAYDTGDDVAMQFIASGKLSVLSPDEHLVFIHPFIGLGLKFLYSTLPQLPWYGLSLIGCHVVAHTIIAGTMLSRRPLRQVAPWFSLWMLTFGFFALTRLQFTTTAYLLGLAGFLLIWEGLRTLIFPHDQEFDSSFTSLHEKKFSIRMICVGVACMWWCEMIRSNSFILCSTMMLPFLGMWLIVRRAGWKPCLAAGALGAVIVAGGMGLYRIHVNYYYTDPDWVGFFEHNELRAKFNDHQIVRYSPENAQIFHDAGWSMNDILLLRSWCFDDQRVYSAETMNKILSARNWYADRYDFGILLESFAEISKGTYAQYFGLMFVLALIVIRKNRTALFMSALSLGSVVGIIVLITVFQKTPPPRVHIPILFWPVLIAGWFGFRTRKPVRVPVPVLIPNIEERVSRGNVLRKFIWRKSQYGKILAYRRWIAPATLALVLISLSYDTYEYSRLRTIQTREFRGLLQSLDIRPENLYVAWGASVQFSNLSPFDSAMWLKDLRMISLGWQQTSPMNHRMTERYGIKNVLSEMHEHPEVRVIHSPLVQKFYADYALEHDNAIVTFDTVGKIYKANISTLTSTKNTSAVSMEKGNVKR